MCSSSVKIGDVVEENKGNIPSRKCLFAARVDGLGRGTMGEASMLLAGGHEIIYMSSRSKLTTAVVSSVLLSIVPSNNPPQSLPQSVRALGVEGCGG